MPPFSLFPGTVAHVEKLVSDDCNVVFLPIFGLTRNPD